jgi:hypothetical protein
MRLVQSDTKERTFIEKNKNRPNRSIKSANCKIFFPNTLSLGWFSLFAPGPCRIKGEAKHVEDCDGGGVEENKGQNVDGWAEIVSGWINQYRVPCSLQRVGYHSRGRWSYLPLTHSLFSFPNFSRLPSFLPFFGHFSRSQRLNKGCRIDG